jgi:hypothetical protein
MKRLLIAVAAILATVGLARADDAAKPEPHKLTLQECQNIRQGLRILDGYTGVDKDGKSVPMQYKLGALRGTIALDAMDLDMMIKAGDEARLKLVKEILPDGTPQLGTKEYADFAAHDPNYKKFVEAYQKILDAPQPVTIPHIKLEQLHLGDPPDGNPIPTDALTLLAPILER